MICTLILVLVNLFSYSNDLGLDALSFIGLSGMTISLYIEINESFIDMRQNDLEDVLQNHPDNLNFYLYNRSIEDAQIFGK